MTKYEQKSFNSPANNKKYNDNYDRIFGKKERELVAEGYCHHLVPEEGHAVVVMKLVGEDEDEHWEVGLDKLHPDTVAGSYLKLYDDGNLELFAPTYTQEDLDTIEEEAAELAEIFGIEEEE